ncbi:MAG: hypothetical protein ACRC9L_09500 [Brevinema sp.]
MKQLAFVFLLLIAPFSYAEQQVTHSALVGSWVYFYITHDSFDTSKPVVTEQRLVFIDGQNVTLNISVRDAEYVQSTVYRLKYALSIRENLPYLTLFTPESKEVLGAYLRMPVKNALEISQRPSFGANTQLYRRNSITLPGQFNPKTQKNDAFSVVSPPNSPTSK